MTQQEEIIAAIQEERRLTYLPFRFRVEQVQTVRDIHKVVVNPVEDRSALDESLEGNTAWWVNPHQGHANILSVVPEDSLLNLRFATASPPPFGEIIWVNIPDFLGELLAYWQNDELAGWCLEWLNKEQYQGQADGAAVPTTEHFGWLRARQRDAFKLCRYRCGFLWGPPGTGKTTTLGCLLSQLLVQFPDERILLLSQTNTAVDQALVSVDKALDHLARTGLEVSAARAKCKRIGLHFVASHYGGREHLLPVIDTALIRRLAELEAAQPNPTIDQAYEEWRDSIDCVREEIRERARQDLLMARLAAMTTTRAVFDHGLLEKIKYDLVVFDEASQIGLAQALVLAQLGKRVLFIGDPKQLAPIIQSDLPIVKRWLGESMFIHMPPDHPSTCILDEQDRMAPPICQLVSRVSYESRLKVAADALANPAWHQMRKLSNLPLVGEEHICIRKIPQEGIPANPGWYRPLSLEFICETVLQLLQATPPEDILVVTPFRAQRHRIRRRLQELGVRGVSVTTIHRAQGSERHTILFDPVKGASRFLTSEEGARIINVAISRPKARLIITLSKGDRKNPILELIQFFANNRVPTSGQIVGNGDNEDQRPYKIWTSRPLPNPEFSPIDEVVKGLVEIIKVEGPMICHRAYFIYAKAAGIEGLPHRIRPHFNEDIRYAIEKGFLVACDEYERPESPIHQIVRTPDTPVVVLRKRGTRSYGEIPPLEILELMKRLRESNPAVSLKDLIQEVEKKYDVDH